MPAIIHAGSDTENVSRFDYTASLQIDDASIPRILEVIQERVRNLMSQSGISDEVTNNVNLIHIKPQGWRTRSIANFAFGNNLMYDPRVDILSTQRIAQVDKKLLETLPVFHFEYSTSGRVVFLSYNGGGVYNFESLVNEAVSPFRVTHKRGLLEQLVDLGLPEEVVFGNKDLTDFERKLKRVEGTGKQTRNPHAIAVDGNGDMILLKAYDRHESASIDAAVNYFLSRHMDFIPGALQPVPLEVGSNRVNIIRLRPGSSELLPIEYWLEKLARYHEEGLATLTENNIVVPDAKILTADYIRDYFTGVRGKRELHSFDFQRLQASCEYLAALPRKSLIHRDIKEEHLCGRFLLDNELSGKGHVAIDLASLYMAYNIPFCEWGNYVDTYLSFRTRLDNVDQAAGEIKKALPHALMHEASREVFGSCKRRLSATEIFRNRKLAVYLKEQF